VLSDVSTSFVSRLRARDPAAWFELWENFGPILRAQITRWGRGRIGAETVKDLSQETLAALATAIDQHDPSRGARFSTWLLAIAKYTLGDEIDRRMAQKRGSGVRPVELKDGGGAAGAAPPDESYEQQIFDAKVGAARRGGGRASAFVDFAVYRMRVFEGKSGKHVASALGLSEPTVSRRLTGIRQRLRLRLGEVVAKYSFTEDERAELSRNGLELSPKKADETLFDEAVGDIYHRLVRQEGDKT
jgi:RNA polymerase sigma factor (sigma-70 family)